MIIASSENQQWSWYSSAVNCGESWTRGCLCSAIYVEGSCCNELEWILSCCIQIILPCIGACISDSCLIWTELAICSKYVALAANLMFTRTIQLPGIDPVFPTTWKSLMICGYRNRCPWTASLAISRFMNAKTEVDHFAKKNLKENLANLEH